MDSINITGAKILFTIPIFGGIRITETQVNSWIVILGILAAETGRLWPCVAAHVFVNARSLVCVTVLADRGSIRYAMDSVLLTAGAIAFFILAVTVIVPP